MIDANRCAAGDGRSDGGFDDRFASRLPREVDHALVT